MMATAFGGVGKRISERGSHKLAFAMDADAEEIALAYRRAVYADCSASELFFGMTAPQFERSMHSNELVWAPDGDEGFDDGSYVFQFEEEDHVRLIAFQSTEGFSINTDSLREVWLPTDDFYEILQRWHDSFMNEWKSLPKVAENKL